MISGILPLFLNVITANRTAAYYSTAYRLADSIIEENRSKPFSEITTEEEIEILDLPNGKYNLVVSSEAIELDEKIKQLDLKISWEFKSPQTLEISTYITEGGIGRW